MKKTVFSVLCAVLVLVCLMAQAQTFTIESCVTDDGVLNFYVVDRQNKIMAVKMVEQDGSERWNVQLPDFIPSSVSLGLLDENTCLVIGREDDAMPWRGLVFSMADGALTNSFVLPDMAKGQVEISGRGVFFTAVKKDGSTCSPLYRHDVVSGRAVLISDRCVRMGTVNTFGDTEAIFYQHEDGTKHFVLFDAAGNVKTEYALQNGESWYQHALCENDLGGFTFVAQYFPEETSKTFVFCVNGTGELVWKKEIKNRAYNYARTQIMRQNESGQYELYGICDNNITTTFEVIVSEDGALAGQTFRQTGFNDLAHIDITSNGRVLYVRDGVTTAFETLSPSNETPFTLPDVTDESPFQEKNKR